jgi:hypothetical protein
MLRLILLQNLGMHFDLTVLLLISEHTVPPDWVFALAPFLCISGVFLHYVSDAQKFFVLQLRKGVVQDGLFARTRNPNYLGEVPIYGGFAVASLALATSPRTRPDGSRTSSAICAGKTGRCPAIVSSLLTNIGRGCSCLRWASVLRGYDPLSRFLQLAFEHGIAAREALWNSNAQERR